MTKPVFLFLGLLWLTHACLMEVWPEHHPALYLLILPQVQRSPQSREMESLGCMAMAALLKPLGLRLPSPRRTFASCFSPKFSVSVYLQTLGAQ